MATAEQLDKGIIKLNKMLNEEGVTSEQRQRILDQMAVLAQEKRSLSSDQQSKPATEQEQFIAELRESKNDLAGFTSSLAAGINRGIIAIPDLPFDLLNLTLSALGVPENIRSGKPSEVINRVTEKTIGIPLVTTLTTPTSAVDTPLERMVGTVAEYTAGSVGGAGLLKQVAKLPTTPRAGPVSPIRESINRADFIPMEAAAGAAAGYAAAPTREYSGSPYLEMLASALGGSLPSALVSGANVIKTQAGQFTRSGAENRVGNVLTENAVDPGQAVQNIANNRLVVEQALPQGETVDPARLSQDEGIMRVVGAAAENDNTVFGILARNNDRVSEAVIEELDSFGGGDTQTFLNTLNNKTLDVLDRIELDIDLARNQADKIEQGIAPTAQGAARIGSEISEGFVSALEQSYKRAKEYERQLWSLVDKRVPMDGKRFRVMSNRLKNKLRRSAVLSDNELNTVFAEINSFGSRGPSGRNTFEALMNFRSRLGEQRRSAVQAGENKKAYVLSQIDDLAMDFIQSSPNYSKYASAAEVTATIYNNYNRGKLGRYLNLDSQGDLRIDPETALDKVVRTGRNIGDVRRAIVAEQQQTTPSGQQIPPARGLTNQIQDMLRLKFSETTDAAGRAKFMKQYEETLNKFPELARDLSNINNELDMLAEVVAKSEARKATLLDKKQTSVAALLGAEPSNIYGSLRGLGRDDLVNINRVAVAEGVEQGLQAVYMRELVERMRVSDSSGQLRNLQDVLSSNKDLGTAFSVVLLPQQRQALSNLNKAAALNNQALNKTRKADDLTTASLPVQVLARWLGVNLAGAVTPGGPAALQTASVFSRVFSKFANSLPSQQNSRVLSDALLDPDYFSDLLKIGLSNQSTENKISAMENFFHRSGIRNTENLQRVYLEELRNQEE